MQPVRFRCKAIIGQRWVKVQWGRYFQLLPLLVASLLCVSGAGACSPRRVLSPSAITPVAVSKSIKTDYKTDYIARLYVDGQGRKMMYYLYMPAGYTPRRSYPLLLFLHGVGERWNAKNTAAQNSALLLGKDYIQALSAHSTDGNTQKPTLQDRWPCFVVVPQIMDNQRWVNAPPASGSYIQAEQPTDDLSLAREIVDQVQKDYQGIDPERLYITGLSMGGQGTWDAITRWPSYFAAAIPVSGASDSIRASNLVNMPLWAFHGSGDPLVSVDGTRRMIAAITAAGGYPRYTEIPSTEHAIWSQVYSAGGYPDLYAWLFAQKKPT